MCALILTMDLYEIPLKHPRPKWQTELASQTKH